MKIATRIVRQIRKWDLATVETRISAPGSDPLQEVYVWTLARANSGVRGGAYRNLRTFVVTLAEMLEVEREVRVRVHPRSSTRTLPTDLVRRACEAADEVVRLAREFAHTDAVDRQYTQFNALWDLATRYGDTPLSTKRPYEFPCA